VHLFGLSCLDNWVNNLVTKVLRLKIVKIRVRNLQLIWCINILYCKYYGFKCNGIVLVSVVLLIQSVTSSGASRDQGVIYWPLNEWYVATSGWWERMDGFWQDISWFLLRTRNRASHRYASSHESSSYAQQLYTLVS
jgi:hypothetical protein